MADFAPNFTGRMRLRYRAGTATHSITWRVARGGVLSNYEAAADKLILLLNDLTALRYTDWAALSWEYCFEDDDVFLPLTPSETLAAGTGGAPTAVGVAKANAFSFVGRSLDGQKAKFFVYGLSRYSESYIIDNFRVTPSEVPQFGLAITRLNETSPALVGSDNATVIWYPYVNQKTNDHWVGLARISG